MFVHSEHFSSLVESSLLVYLVSLITLTFISAVCITGCKDKQQLRRLRGKTTRKTSNGSSIKVTAEVEKNGDIQVNGRSLGHDRALPEIPATASGVASTDDDDDEDEGHYDVISKNRRLASLGAPQPAAGSSRGLKLHEANSQLKRGNHPYEKVRGDPDSESATYAGIPDNFPVGRKADVATVSTSQILDPAGPPSDPLYAGVGDDGCSVDSSTSTSHTLAHHSTPLYSTVGARNEDRARTKHNRDRLADESAASSMTPPVPDRCYETNDHVDGFDDTSVSAVSSLVPLHVTSAGEGGSWAVCSATMGNRSPGTGSSFWNASHVSSSGELSVPCDAAAGASAPPPVHESDAVPQAASAETGGELQRRVPNYSSLTARESLENLRRRQLLKLQQRAPPQEMADIGAAAFVEADGTYDTINYDLIKPQQGNVDSARTVPAILDTQVYNNGSDLYAEISTGPSSTRSSTYACVGDLVVNTTGHAPVPPSVDALQQLTHYVVATDSYADPGPGYSRVDRPRPHSTHLTTVNQPAATAVTTSFARGRRSPVYAVISKPSRQNWELETPANEGNSAGGVSSTSASNLYSQVTGRSQHRRAMSNEVSFIDNGRSRTVELPHNNSRFSTTCRGDVGFHQNYSGYASIDDAPVPSDGLRLLMESNYDTVVEVDTNSIAGAGLAFNDFDPNYETVGVLTEHSTRNDSSMRPFGVAHEIQSFTSDDQFASHMHNGFLDSAYRQSRTSPSMLIREHIYQEVTSNGNFRGAYIAPSLPLAGPSGSGNRQLESRNRMLSTDL